MANYTFDEETMAPKDAVRLFLGDTDAAKWQLSDETIVYLLNQEGSAKAAAALGAEMLAAKYARMVDVSIGTMRSMESQMHEHYKALAVSLRVSNGSISTGFYAGGLSKAEKALRETEGDLVQPSFTRDLHECPSPIP